jgi:hypothetical protein
LGSEIPFQGRNFSIQFASLVAGGSRGILSGMFHNFSLASIVAGLQTWALNFLFRRKVLVFMSLVAGGSRGFLSGICSVFLFNVSCGWFADFGSELPFHFQAQKKKKDKNLAFVSFVDMDETC